MTFYELIRLIIELILLAYILVDLILSREDIRYQKLWYKEKALLIKRKPAISRAELCEYYVMFCLRNDCKVDF